MSVFKRHIFNNAIAPLRRRYTTWAVCALLLSFVSALSADSRDLADGGFLYSRYLQSVGVQDASGVSGGQSGSFQVNIQRAPSIISAAGRERLRAATAQELQNLSPLVSGSGYLTEYLTDGQDFTADFAVQTEAGFGRLTDIALQELFFAATDDVRRQGVLRRSKVEVQTPLGNRRGNVALDLVGVVSETNFDASAWQLRGFASEDDSVGGNVGLLYRRVGGNALIGVNSFVDYENSESGDFLRWSVGGEARSTWLDVFGNYYRAITAPQTQIGADGRREIAYTADGFDVEVNLHSPRLAWLSAVLGYYAYDGYQSGGFFRDSEEGLRAGFKLSPRSLPLELEIEYERGDGAASGARKDDFGGRLVLHHEFGQNSVGAFTEDEFRPQDWFFASAEREYTQRIYIATLPVPVVYSSFLFLQSVLPDGNSRVEITGGNVTLTATFSEANGSSEFSIVGTDDDRIDRIISTIVVAEEYELPTASTLTVKAVGAVSAALVWADRQTSVQVVGGTATVTVTTVSNTVTTTVTMTVVGGSTVAFVRDKDDDGVRKLTISDGVAVVHTKVPVEILAGTRATVSVSPGRAVTVQYISAYESLRVEADDQNVEVFVLNSNTPRSCANPQSFAAGYLQCPLSGPVLTANPAYNDNRNAAQVSGRNVRLTYTETLLSMATDTNFAVLSGIGGRGANYEYSVISDDEGLVTVSVSTDQLFLRNNLDITVSTGNITGTITLQVEDTDSLQTRRVIYTVEITKVLLSEVTAEFVAGGARVNEGTVLPIIAFVDKDVVVATVTAFGGDGEYTFTRISGGLGALTINMTTGEIKILQPATTIRLEAVTAVIKVSDNTTMRVSGDTITPDITLSLLVSVVRYRETPGTSIGVHPDIIDTDTTGTEFLFHNATVDAPELVLATLTAFGALRTDGNYEYALVAGEDEFDIDANGGAITFNGDTPPSLYDIYTLTAAATHSTDVSFYEEREWSLTVFPAGAKLCLLITLLSSSGELATCADEELTGGVPFTIAADPDQSEPISIQVRLSGITPRNGTAVLPMSLSISQDPTDSTNISVSIIEGEFDSDADTARRYIVIDSSNLFVGSIFTLQVSTTFGSADNIISGELPFEIGTGKIASPLNALDVSVIEPGGTYGALNFNTHSSTNPITLSLNVITPAFLRIVPSGGVGPYSLSIDSTKTTSFISYQDSPVSGRFDVTLDGNNFPTPTTAIYAMEIEIQDARQEVQKATVYIQLPGTFSIAGGDLALGEPSFDDRVIVNILANKNNALGERGTDGYETLWVIRGMTGGVRPYFIESDQPDFISFGTVDSEYPKEGNKFRVNSNSTIGVSFIHLDSVPSFLQNNNPTGIAADGAVPLNITVSDSATPPTMHTLLVTVGFVRRTPLAALVAAFIPSPALIAQPLVSPAILTPYFHSISQANRTTLGTMRLSGDVGTRPGGGYSSIEARPSNGYSAEAVPGTNNEFVLYLLSRDVSSVYGIDSSSQSGFKFDDTGERSATTPQFLANLFKS